MLKILSSWTLVFAAAATTACSSSTPVDEPRVEFSDIGFSLHLPLPMQKALDSFAPGFKTIQTASYRTDVGQLAAQEGGGAQALFATIGDFDGDGTKDAVVEGTARGDEALHVIAILNGAAPSAVEVTQFHEYDADAVGIYLSKPAAGQTGAFEVVNYPDASTLYRYENGAFAGTKIGG